MTNRRRRRRWGRPDTAVPPEDIGEEFSTDSAMRLWVGAADRSWVRMAPSRWGQLHRGASQQARAAAAGRFDLLGSGEVSILDADGRFRWHDDFKGGASFPSDCLYLDVPTYLPQEGTDIKVPWELSRFQHVFAFVWTDPDRYGPVFLDQWRDWMESNPVARGVNWACTMDVALRGISWTVALAAWGSQWDRRTQMAMAAALATHGHFIRDNLEWAAHARTNHYFTDIVALAVLGAALQGYPPARKWSAFAAKELHREILQEFANDGFNKECSTTYHRLMVELATLGDLGSRIGGHDLGEEVRGRIVSAYRALAVLCGPTGRVPMIGDNDSSHLFAMVQREDRDIGWVLPIGAVVYDAEDLGIGEASPEVALLCGPRALESYRPQKAQERIEIPRQLPDSGFFVLGNDTDNMVIRCGPTTYRPVGGHQHLDQLSFTLDIGGEEIIVDPGQYCYSPYPKLRDQYRYTSAHNTLQVDGQPQCRVFIRGRMIFSVIPEASPECDQFEVAVDGGRFVGRHRGYQRLPGGADHRREVRYDRQNAVWLVKDTLDLTGQHVIEWFFHLAEGAVCREADLAWRLSVGPVEIVLRWVPDDPPPGALREGWVAPGYGMRVPGDVLVFQKLSVGRVQQAFEIRVVSR